MGWNLRIDSLGLDLALAPVIEESEFADSELIPVVYWEGAVAATGSRSGAAVSGNGFVEMVGYVPSDLSALADPGGPTIGRRPWALAEATAPQTVGRHPSSR